VVHEHCTEAETPRPLNFGMRNAKKSVKIYSLFALPYRVTRYGIYERALFTERKSQSSLSLQLFFKQGKYYFVL